MSILKFFRLVKFPDDDQDIIVLYAKIRLGIDDNLFPAMDGDNGQAVTLAQVAFDERMPAQRLRCRQLDDANAFLHFQVIDDVVGSQPSTEMNTGFMLRKDDFVRTNRLQNRLLRLRFGFSDDARDAHSQQQSGGQNVAFEIIADTDEAGLKLIQTEIVQGFGIGGVELDDVRQVGGEVLHPLDVVVYGQDVVSVSDQGFGDAGAKATEAYDDKFMLARTAPPTKATWPAGWRVGLR